MLKLLSAIVCCTLIFLSPRSEAKELSKDELAIKAKIDENSQGYIERDLDKIMIMYDNNELMFFDLMPPLKDCCGSGHARKKLEAFFEGTVGPVTSEFRDLTVHAEGNLGYTTAIYYFAFTSKEGKKHEMTARITDVWRRLDGKWSIVHEHCSLPTTVVDWMD